MTTVTKKDASRRLTENRRARHEYEILETYEAGIVLTGTEIKSLRAGKATLQDAYAAIENGEVVVHNMNISPYEQGNRFNHEPKRPRKLLLHKYEINKLQAMIKEKGLTLIPLSVYLKRGMAKMDLAVAKGKKLYDKRQTLAKADAQRDIDRALRDRQKM